MAGKGEGLTFTYDEAARVLRVSYEPVPGASGEIDQAWLVSHLQAQGLGDFALNDAAVGVVLSRYANAQPLHGLAIAMAEDASVHIYPALDQMSATMTVKAARGGRPADRSMIERSLSDAGIIAGILRDVIDQVVERGSCNNVVVARGKEPVHGEDGRLECLVDEAPSRVPKVDANGLADYRDLGAIPTVKPGQPLMRRVRATQGENGYTINGLSIPARNGKEVFFAGRMQGVEPDPNNPDQMNAGIAGQPVLIKNGIMVEPIYRAAEVSVATGNIDFDGLVIVEGDVQAGMCVKATGDIHVNGTVEAATLQSGGNIVIKGGVVGNLGRKESVAPLISCKGSFSATFAQQARIEAGDSIYIDDVVMQSELTATNQVIVGDKNRGHLIGGQVQATLLVKANMIGSQAHVATRVDVGINPQISAKLAQIEKQRNELLAKLEQVQKVLDLRVASPARVPEEMAAKAQAAAVKLHHDIDHLGDEENLLTAQLELAEGARVVVDKGVHEGVTLFCGRHSFRVEHTRNFGGSFVVNADGDFVYDPTMFASPEEIRAAWQRARKS